MALALLFFSKLMGISYFFSLILGFLSTSPLAGAVKWKGYFLAFQMQKALRRHLTSLPQNRHTRCSIKQHKESCHCHRLFAVHNRINCLKKKKRKSKQNIYHVEQKNGNLFPCPIIVRILNVITQKNDEVISKAEKLTP